MSPGRSTTFFLLCLYQVAHGFVTISMESSPSFGSRRGRQAKLRQKQEENRVRVLKRSRGWACIQGCGACCYLAPDERPDLEEWLSEDDFKLYHSLVGSDGWCMHYDKTARACTIYEDRPQFCRVKPEVFESQFGVPPEDMESFCSDCCREHITDVYGETSGEMKAFNSAISKLEGGATPLPEDPFDQRPRKDQIEDWGE
ncbi:unnamed protein product [Chrysoparadoxa australica]